MSAKITPAQLAAMIMIRNGEVYSADKYYRFDKWGTRIGGTPAPNTMESLRSRKWTSSATRYRPITSRGRSWTAVQTVLTAEGVTALEGMK